MAPSETTLEFCNRLWDNWKPENGKNQCEGCPAHWSNRSDFPGDAERRESSHGHRPWYGDGNLTDVEVVLLGHEPGPGSIGEESEDATNYTESSFEDVRDSDIANVPLGAGDWLPLTKRLFELVGDEFSCYWTQVKKCNELPENNKAAEHQCAGIGDENEGYLFQELATVDPNYVIGFGGDVHRVMTGVYDIEDLGRNFEKPVASGDSAAGLRPLEVENADFTYIPTVHPTRGVQPDTKNQLELDPGPDQTDSERYYELFAEDFIDQVKTGTI